MRPNTNDNVPIIRTLNELSTKIIDRVAPIDGTDITEDKFIDDIRLVDLQEDAAQDNILLRVRDQKQFFDVDVHPDQVIISAINSSTDSVDSLLLDLQSETRTICRDGTTLGFTEFDDKVDSNHNENQEDGEHLASYLRLSCLNLTEVLTSCRAQLPSSTNEGVSDQLRLLESADDFTQSMLNRLVLTHATSTEFLKHFWSAFLSGDPKRSSDIRNMLDSLGRSLQRITAIREATEEEVRHERQNRPDGENGESEKKRKKKRRTETPILRGAELIDQIISAQKKAINTAISRYHQAIEGEQE